MGVELVPGQGKASSVGVWLVPWDKERCLLTFHSTSWDKLCLSHWDKHWDKHSLSQSVCPTGTGCACPSGLSQWDKPGTGTTLPSELQRVQAVGRRGRLRACLGAPGADLGRLHVLRGELPHAQHRGIVRAVVLQEASVTRAVAGERRARFRVRRGLEAGRALCRPLLVLEGPGQARLTGSRPPGLVRQARGHTRAVRHIWTPGGARLPELWGSLAPPPPSPPPPASRTACARRRSREGPCVICAEHRQSVMLVEAGWAVVACSAQITQGPSPTPLL